MLEIIRSGTKYDFVSKYKFTAIISAIIVTISIVFIFTNLNYGVDFRGGAEAQIKFAEKIRLDSLRISLKKGGFRGVGVQTIGESSNNEFLLKVPASEKDLNKVSHEISMQLKKDFAGSGVEIRKVDIVGPKAGAQLRLSGFLAMFWALLAIMIYIALRFNIKYSPGAIIALFHDVSIVLGIFALTGTEFTLQTVAALLAVIGYSVNDTVVIYDRVREHETKYVGVELKNHINNAVNETLSRTVWTSGTTLFISLSMYFFGGLAIRDFFLAITLGVVVGTYSSVFVAAPVTLFFDRILGKNKA